jgi:hypothetical protein
MVYRLIEERTGIQIMRPKWLEQIADEIFVDDKRVRRYFPAFLEALYTISLIRSFLPGRPRGSGRLEVDFADFAIATLIFDHVFVESLGLGKGAAEATRRTVETISASTGKPVNAKELADKLDISKDTAYNKLRNAAQAGVIRIANKPERGNRKTYWALPAPHFVPDPKSLYRKLRLKETVKFVHPLSGEWIVYKPDHE